MSAEMIANLQLIAKLLRGEQIEEHSLDDVTINTYLHLAGMVAVLLRNTYGDEAIEIIEDWIAENATVTD